MLCDREYEKSDFFFVYCPECGGLCKDSNLENSTLLSCQTCLMGNNAQRLFRCKKTTCGFYVMICTNCSAESYSCEKSQKSNIPSTRCNVSVQEKISGLSYLFWIFVLGLLFAFIAYYFASYFENKKTRIINKLRKDYPAQKNETWYHILSVLDKNIPSVKTIIFLHGEDKETSRCLTNELVQLYTQNENVKIEDITFSEFEAEDYGFLLEHYHGVIKKFRIFITDLNKVSGYMAQIFHSLCDEVASDIKPSFFIFTLKYNEKTENFGRPVEKATSLLREAWGNLPENVLSPLLSRIVRNVVIILPEHRKNC